MKTVSVIIPIYNLEDKLNRCLESVVQQSYKELQIILIDDGSSDASGQICRKYAERDKRILYIKKSNGGVSSARNCGLEHAMGEYIMFVDGDDSISAKYVETYVQQAIDRQADVVIGGLTMFDADSICKKVPRVGIYDRKAFLSVVCDDGTEIYGYACNKLFRRSLLENSKIRFNETMHSQEDLAFALDAYKVAERIACMDYCGYSYYHEPSNRKLPPEHLLRNQIKLFEIADRSGSNTIPMLARFQRLLYSVLYHADSKQQIKQLMNLCIPCDLMCRCPTTRMEVQIIIRQFNRKNSEIIWLYFKTRERLKRIIR